MRTAIWLWILLASFAFAGPSAGKGDRATELLQTLRERHPGTTIEHVYATAIPSLYEVWMGENVAFVNENDLRYFIFGRLVDIETLRDLTGRNRPMLSGDETQRPPIPHSALPLHDAIRAKKGTGARSLVIFSDPRCSYCKQLEIELDAVSDVTIYNFLVPFTDAPLAVSIWCAKHRADAWRKAMKSEGQGIPARDCGNPIKRNLELAKKLAIRGTPTLIFPNGDVREGFMTAKQIDAALNAARQ